MKVKRIKRERCTRMQAKIEFAPMVTGQIVKVQTGFNGMQWVLVPPKDGKFILRLTKEYSFATYAVDLHFSMLKREFGLNLYQIIARYGNINLYFSTIHNQFCEADMVKNTISLGNGSIEW